MANKKNKAQIQRAQQQQIKQKQYDVATKNLFIFPCIALGLVVIALVSFFANFVEIYASGVGVEQSVSGWSFIAAFLSNGYTSPSIGTGALANVFYVWAKDWCAPLATVTFIAALILVVNLAAQIVAIVKKMHVLNAVSTVLGLVAVVVLIICYAKGLDMKNAEILSGFCKGNPICSIKSYAIVPAILTIGATAVNAFASVKYFQSSALLKK